MAKEGQKRIKPQCTKFSIGQSPQGIIFKRTWQGRRRGEKKIVHGPNGPTSCPPPLPTQPPISPGDPPSYRVTRSSPGSSLSHIKPSIPVQRAFCSSSLPPFHRFQTLPLSVLASCAIAAHHGWASILAYRCQEKLLHTLHEFFKFFFLGAVSDRLNWLYAKGGPLYAGSVSAGGFAVDAAAGAVVFFSNWVWIKLSEGASVGIESKSFGGSWRISVCCEDVLSVCTNNSCWLFPVPVAPSSAVVGREAYAMQACKRRMLPGHRSWHRERILCSNCHSCRPELSANGASCHVPSQLTKKSVTWSEQTAADDMLWWTHGACCQYHWVSCMFLAHDDLMVHMMVRTCEFDFFLVMISLCNLDEYWLVEIFAVCSEKLHTVKMATGSGGTGYAYASGGRPSMYRMLKTGNSGSKIYL